MADRPANATAGDPLTSSQQVVTRNFLALGSGEVLARVLAFGATVILAHRLGAAGFGHLAIATALVLYLSKIADAGMDLGLGVREIAHASDRLSEIVPTILTLRLLLAFVLIVVFGGGALLLLPSPDGPVIALYTLTLLTVAVSTRWVHVGLERTGLVGLARCAGEALMLLGVLLWVHDIADLTRAPLAQVAGDAVAALLLVLALRPLGVLRLAWRSGVIRPLLRRAVPYVGSTLLGLMIFNADLIFLRILRDTTTVGYYAAAYAPISFLLNVGVAYSLSLLPTLTRLRHDPAAERDLYHTSSAHVMAVALPVAVGGLLVARQIIALIFGPEFVPAGSALAILICSVPMSAVRDLSVVALLSRGREDLLFRILTASAAMSVVLCLALIPPFGMIGAAVATLVTEAFRMVLSMWYARSLGFPVPPIRRAWRPALAAAVMAAVLLAAGLDSIWAAVPAGGAVFFLVLALTGGVRFRRGEIPRLSV